MTTVIAPPPVAAPSRTDALRHVALVAHRPGQFTGRDMGWLRKKALPEVLDVLRDEYGARIALSPLSVGLGLDAADAALARGYSLWAYRPYPAYVPRMSDTDRDAWQVLRGRSACDLTATDQHRPDAYRRRDALLLGDADVLVGFHVNHPTSNATATVMRHAFARGLPTLSVNATTRTICWADEQTMQELSAPSHARQGAHRPGHPAGRRGAGRRRERG